MEKFLLKISLLAFLVIEGDLMAEEQLISMSARHQLRMAEHTMQRYHQEPQIRISKRSSDQCGQERLDSILRACEAAASAPSGLLMAATSSGSVSTEQGPLVFCGADCKHRVILYANQCNNNEFLVNVSGACKLSGSTLTVECIYAVVLVKTGITSCIKMALDVDSTHKDIMPPLEGSREYVDRQCCSLESAYESDVVHEVYADSMGRAVIEPRLEPPWLQTNSSDYQAVIDVVNSELCLVQTTTTEVVTDSTVPLSTNSTVISVQQDSEASSASSMAVNGASSLLPTQHKVLSLFALLCFFL